MYNFTDGSICGTTPPCIAEMRDWDTDHFDMQWAAPRNDGGSRITGYELEARLWREPAWFKAGEVRRMIRA